MRVTVGPLRVAVLDADAGFVSNRSGEMVPPIGPRVSVRLDEYGPMGLIVDDPALLRLWAEAFTEAAVELESKLGRIPCPERSERSP